MARPTGVAVPRNKARPVGKPGAWQRSKAPRAPREDDLALPTNVKKAAASVARWVEHLAFLAPLATRIVIGLAFIQTGLGKWNHLDRTTEFFAGVGIPFPAANAVFIATLELVGGGALFAGLLTRPFAALLSCTMVVALMTADRQTFLSSWSSASEATPTDVTALVFLLFLLWLIFFGAGGASLDRLLSRLWKSRRVPGSN
jgi:putative oxidoreductase